MMPSSFSPVVDIMMCNETASEKKRFLHENHEFLIGQERPPYSQPSLDRTVDGWDDLCLILHYPFKSKMET